MAGLEAKEGAALLPVSVELRELGTTTTCAGPRLVALGPTSQKSIAKAFVETRRKICRAEAMSVAPHWEVLNDFVASSKAKERVAVILTSAEVDAQGAAPARAGP